MGPVPGSSPSDYYPSPASPRDVLVTPQPAHTHFSLLRPTSSSDDSTLCFDDHLPAIPSFPDPSRANNANVTTPIVEDAIAQRNIMNVIVGGALAPMPTTPPLFPPTKPGPGLRLPSFEALGIAAPHPDRFGVDIAFDSAATERLDSAMKDPSTHHGAHPDSALADALNDTHASNTHPDIHSDPRLFTGGGRAVSTPLKHDVAILTPPADMGDIMWNPVATVSGPPIDSPSTDPDHSGSHTPSAQGAATASSSSVPQPADDPASSDTTPPWIEPAIRVLLESLRTTTLAANPLRVLSHALPSPSTTGHIFPTIIDAIHGSTPAQPTVWISVFHAIQGRFNLADLPTSPPNTPGPAIGGDDYFTQKVFDTAVSISDYQQDLSSLPRSPRPVVPPSSINVSIVERYIPPSSPNEFKDMFELNGPSILVDRLVELSPNNGTLFFVYPTRAGAQTFMKEYLGPILDPQLRSLVVVNGLSSNLSRSLGRMVAADQLPDYATLRRSMANLCAKLTQRSPTVEKFHGRRANFSLVHASCEEVQIGREAWSKDWWAKQEKQRIREVMTRYAQDAQKQSSNEHMDRSPTPTELIQQLLDGVTRRSSYPSGREPKTGIEVSVFVIKRSD